MRTNTSPTSRARHHITFLGLILLILGNVAVAEKRTEYSPPVANDHPVQVFWGDTHLHTNLSPDAFSFGNRSVSPEQAYRFARGETVVSQGGIKAKLARPLDFLMVSDHSEFMGIFPRVFSRSPDIIDTPLGKRWLSHIQAGEPERITMEFGLLSMGATRSGNTDQYIGVAGITRETLDGLRDVEIPQQLQQSIWGQVGVVADAFNEPGRFTTFIGYEWTSMPNGNNLHRNVMFRDNGSKTSQVIPFTSMESGNPEDLWRFMADYEAKTGGTVLAIPHNGNVSNGLMFAETTLDGQSLNEDYAKRRMRWEPVVEVTQIKGDGEAHPFLSPNDEFADYETWDKANLTLTVAKENSMLEFEYARSALKNGLAMEQTLGANPYQFGMIGSTDSHTSLATADEDNFFGKKTSAEPAKGRANKNYRQLETEIRLKHWETAASGYAAIWAKENTRESLFDAIQRKETYATTGPRMTVRFFGGWSFEEDDIYRPDFAMHGYRNGVPMGGNLPSDDRKISPRFLISALKDPLGANLDRIQIVKGWTDSDGNSHEMVYNVAASDGRKIRRNAIKPVGNTVNTEEASYRNSIGDTLLAVVWEDPDFDSDHRAFYYARVLEIPTPRWTTYDTKIFGEAAPERAPALTRERAYTSPIWYSPAEH